MVLGFHMRKNFTESYLRFGHAPTETFASAVVGRKGFKNAVLKGAPNREPVWSSVCFGPDLSAVDTHQNCSVILRCKQ
jgi:hypothetical protein